MRLCGPEDLPQLEVLYTQAIEHAENVGHIDWPKPFPIDLLKGYVLANELYCFEESDVALAAAIRVSENPNPLIWPEANDERASYGGKAATSAAVQNKNYGKTVILPSLIQHARDTGISILRGDSLADNPRLARYYSGSGYSNLGNKTFYSDIQDKEVTVIRWQLRV